MKKIALFIALIAFSSFSAYASQENSVTPPHFKALLKSGAYMGGLEIAKSTFGNSGKLVKIHFEPNDGNSGFFGGDIWPVYTLFFTVDSPTGGTQLLAMSILERAPGRFEFESLEASTDRKDLENHRHN